MSKTTMHGSNDVNSGCQHATLRKLRQLKHANKHMHTSPYGYARTYVAVPPDGGWVGGLPESNGWKPKGGSSGKGK